MEGALAAQCDLGQSIDGRKLLSRGTQTMDPVETVEYVVKKKDSLWNIVKQQGFPPKDWKRIYEAPYNRELRKLRPDPNVILPGDRVRLPRYNSKQIQELLQKITGTERQLEDVRKMRKRLLENIDTIRALIKKNQDIDEQKIQRLMKEADGLDYMAASASGECEDIYTCIGAGFAVQMMIDEARALTKKASTIREKLTKDSEDYESGFEDLRKNTERLQKTEERLLNEVQTRRNEWKKASSKPY